MDFVFGLLNNEIVLYGLGAVVLIVAYQRLAPMIRMRTPAGGGTFSVDGLLSMLLGARYADAKRQKAVMREKKLGNFLAAGRLYEDAEQLDSAVEAYVAGDEFFAAAQVLERQGKGERAAETYLQANDYKKAAQLFTEVGKAGRAAELFLEKGNTLEAARLFAQAGQSNRAADLYMKAGYPLRAAEAFEKHGDFLKAAEAYEKHFTENVTFATTYSSTAKSADHKSALLAGRLFQKAGDQQRAYQIYSRGSYFKEAAGALENLGQSAMAAELFMRGEDPERAAIAYEKAGDRVKAANLRGEVALKSERVAEAAAFFKQGQDYQRSAELFESIGMLSEAAGSYEAAESWVAAGGVYIRAGLKERGAAAYERGNDFETAGKLYEEAGNGRKAMEMFARAGLTFKSGEAAANAGDRERAIAQLQRVGPGDENYRAATELLARMFVESKMPALAIERLEKVLGQEPVSAASLDLYYWLAIAHETAGSGATALGIYKKIQAEDLSYRDVAQRTARLQASPSGVPAAPLPLPVPPPPKATAAPVVPAASLAAGATPATNPAGPPTPAISGTAARLRFVLRDELGGGPFGVVHRGEDLVEQKIVALRLLSPELLAIEGALAAFTADLKASAQVAHPALVRTLGFVELSGRRAIVTEWVTGRNFGEALQAGHKLPPAQVLSLGRALFQALQAIHAKGLVHGSLQPTNVMVAAGQVRLTDLGLGRVRQRFPAKYRAPGGGYTVAADLYAAAAVLYHLLAGANPTGPAAPSPPSSRVAGVPAPLERALLRCLEPQPNARPRTAEEVLQDLLAPPA